MGRLYVSFLDWIFLSDISVISLAQVLKHSCLTSGLKKISQIQ